MFSRRNFLQYTAGTMGAGLLAPLTALAADQSGYKALVMIFLGGGADAHDMLIGYDQPSYDLWSNARGSIIDQIDRGALKGSRSREQLLELNPTDGRNFPGRAFAMPPELVELHGLFQDGKLAIVPNVGPLLEPTTRSMIENGTALLPAHLFSHNDQVSTWCAFAGEGARAGWGGMLLDAFRQQSPYAAVSVGSQTVFLQGQQTRHLQVPANGQLRQAFGVKNRLWSSAQLANAVQDFYGSAANHSNIPMMRDIVRLQGQAVEDTDIFISHLEQQTLGNNVRVAQNPLSERLGTVVNIIGARNAIGINRQVFFIRFGGFDTHNNHAQQMPQRLRILSEAIHSFQSVLEEAGLADNVTTVTASDFGRTLVANASGTDHGWGGHHVVFGGAVRGRQIAGDVPSFELGNEQHRKRGVLIPQISVEQYGAELGRWFGLGESELDDVFANRRRFDTTPLGLFK